MSHTKYSYIAFSIGIGLKSSESLAIIANCWYKYDSNCLSCSFHNSDSVKYLVKIAVKVRRKGHPAANYCE